MAKPNALQEQLLKAGLAKKSQASAAAREQAKARQGKAPDASAEIQREAERARQEKVERDRAIAAERNAQLRAGELKAQARQIIQAHAVPHVGDSEYRFSEGSTIRTLYIDAHLRKALSAGALVIVAHGEGFAVLPRAAAEKVRERTPDAIVVDHGRAGDTSVASTGNAEDDAYYAQFQIPDDLVW